MASKKRKPKAKRKEQDVRIRMTSEQKARFTRASERDGAENLSAWIRRLATQAAEASEASDKAHK